MITFGVLGPVTAWDEAGEEPALRGPRHRAVLARLIVARGRVVPVGHLVDDLWTAPPEGAVSAVRTFVAALRRALEPDRPPRTPPALLVTEGPGYALRLPQDAVDAWRFEAAAVNPQARAAANPEARAAAHPHARAAASPEAQTPEARLAEALSWWRGPAYADFPEAPWARSERARLTELRLAVVEALAQARLTAGRPDLVVPALDAHVTEHPWREEGWRLLALALYRTGRQGDALAVLRRARGILAEGLGVDPGPALSRLERDVLRREPALDPAPEVWASTAAAYERLVGVGSRARLESTVGLLRSLAVTGGGGLGAAREQRLATIEEAERLGDPVLTARVIGAYDVPASWPRSDDPAQAAAVVAAAQRTVEALDLGKHDVLRARLLATVAVESRGGNTAGAAAREAERLARTLEDPGLLAFALNGVWMQTFARTGLAPERDAIGAELTALAARHGLVTAEVLGRLIRLQSHSALGDFAGADLQAKTIDDLSVRHELPLAGIFTAWYGALRLAAAGDVAAAERAYRRAAALLGGAGMPGLETGLLPLALLGIGIRAPHPEEYGPYEPWVRPLLAGGGLGRLPDPPHDLLAEGLWCLVARAAVRDGDRPAMLRARAALLPAAAELAGAASGMLTLGPVRTDLTALDIALGR